MADDCLVCGSEYAQRVELSDAAELADACVWVTDDGDVSLFTHPEGSADTVGAHAGPEMATEGVIGEVEGITDEDAEQAADHLRECDAAYMVTVADQNDIGVLTLGGPVDQIPAMATASILRQMARDLEETATQAAAQQQGGQGSGPGPGPGPGAGPGGPTG